MKRGAEKVFPTAGLLRWFAREGRVLPWRDGSDRGDGRARSGGHGALARRPYDVWIFETMVQQTQVATALPYYERWMKKYPDVRALAKTSEEEALLYFQGLGYYRRLRSLLRGAKVIMESYEGDFPRTEKELLRVPGIGAYTAGAILSFAYKQRVAVVDGNIVRVLSRYACLEGVRTKLARKPSAAWELTEGLLPRTGERAMRLNEALMELGSLVCTVTRPRCLERVAERGVPSWRRRCPLMESCAAYRLGVVEEYPHCEPKLRVLKVSSSVFVIQRGEEFLLIKRCHGQRFAGMWEFPALEHHGAHESLDGAGYECLLGETLAVPARIDEFVTTLTAQYTRYRASVKIFRASLQGAGSLLPKGVMGKGVMGHDGREYRWASLGGLKKLGLSSLHARVRKLLMS